MLKEIVAKNRSYRRFYQDREIDGKTLVELVALARLCPSGRNLQPLKFFISSEKSLNGKIFPNLAWAGYLKDWDGPVDGERPAAYIVVLEDQNISSTTQWDQGIMAQTIMLGAAEKGLGGCMIGSGKREELAKALNIPANRKVVLVLAIGYPKELVVVEPLPGNGSVVYWRDSGGTHHVPKRDIDELLIK